MKNSFLIAVDDSPGSGKVVDIAMAQAKRVGADLVVAYVIEWSAYSFNMPEENAERHKRREEKIDRAEGQIVEPVVAKLKEAGLKAWCAMATRRARLWRSLKSMTSPRSSSADLARLD